MEEMLDDILVTQFKGIRIIAESSRFDDQRSHFDKVLSTPSGIKFATDYTATGSPKQMAEKTKELIAHPLVKRRDDKGNVVDEEEIFKVIISVDDKVEWGKAYNKYLEEQVGSPTDYLTDRARECAKISERVVRQIDGLPAALKLMGKSDEYVKHIMEHALPIRHYFATELAGFKNKKNAPQR
jgi:hypothetical protein